MDVDFFLRLRTNFILKFYDEAVKPFLQTQRLIEAEEEPFVPTYSEDGSRRFKLSGQMPKRPSKF
jgi:hypothetical protein